MCTAPVRRSVEIRECASAHRRDWLCYGAGLWTLRNAGTLQVQGSWPPGLALTLAQDSAGTFLWDTGLASIRDQRIALDCSASLPSHHPPWLIDAKYPGVHHAPAGSYIYIYIYIIEVYLIYSVVLISAVQQSDSVIHQYTFFFYILFHYDLSQEIAIQ